MPVPRMTSGPAGRRRVVNKLIGQPWTGRARRSRALRRHLDARGYITPHFTWAEYACTDGTAVPTGLRHNARRLCWKLEVMRHQLGDVAMTIDGPFRTRARNTAVGGARDSRHVHADAADFFAGQVDRWIAASAVLRTRGDVIRIAERVFTDGGVGNETSGTLHVDARGFRARFVTWIRS